MSRLLAIMRRPLPEPLATATGATVATEGPRNRPSVAKVATVAVAPDLPSEWRDGLARLISCGAPADMGEARWRQLRDDALSFVQRWGIEAERLGWSTLELFGHDPNPLARRLDTAGLVALLRGRPVVALDGERATILNAGGDCHRFCGRPFPGVQRPALGSVPIWALATQDGDLA